MIFLGIITLVIILCITIFNIGIGENPKRQNDKHL